ncbi:MAG: hypothetical protein FJ387_16205 [Verrucomicrobia bacterium]|nr:hypothetical protein [Verrucomicrobiota bacterium]
MTGRGVFFRQTGWMVFATTLGGVFMWLVHIPAAAGMPDSEYGVFLALLQVLNLMLIPAIALQTVFAQQTAAAVTEPQQRELASSVRVLMGVVSAIWLAMLALTFVLWRPLVQTLQIANPAGLWIAVAIGLAMLWWPILQGILQGRQDFLWMGWLQVVNGCGRFAGVVLLVTWVGWHAAGAMTAALIGFWTTVGVAAWHSRAVWSAPGSPVPWRAWFGRVVPLTLGLGASQFMMAADQVLVQSIFDKNVTAQYGAAGTIGRALVFFTASVFAVMFPKIVASVARAEKTNVMGLALGITVLLGGGAALACTVLPELPLRIVYRTKYLGSAPLVPWFAWCMLPLTLANVLIGNLLARERFRVVPWLLLVAAGYGAALLGRAETFQAAEQFAAFKMVIQTIGTFSLLLFAVAAWFTWGHRDRRLPHTGPRRGGDSSPSLPR